MAETTCFQLRWGKDLGPSVGRGQVQRLDMEEVDESSPPLSSMTTWF